MHSTNGCTSVLIAFAASELESQAAKNKTPRINMLFDGSLILSLDSIVFFLFLYIYIYICNV